MTYSHEVEHMCVVKKGPNHGPAPIPEEGKWVKAKEIVDPGGICRRQEFYPQRPLHQPYGHSGHI